MSNQRVKLKRYKSRNEKTTSNYGINNLIDNPK